MLVSTVADTILLEAVVYTAITVHICERLRWAYNSDCDGGGKGIFKSSKSVKGSSYAEISATKWFRTTFLAKQVFADF